MGIADSFKDKAKEAVDKIGGDKAKKGVDAAADQVDERTGGKYSKHIDTGQQKAGEYIDGLDDENPR
ncbi:antitoxin [Actinomycetes bacterium KLBMP 9797]